MSNSELNHYFPHDSNARSDDKILSLRSELGNKAYAIYFMVLELMREEENYCLKANGNLPGRLSMELSESKDFMEEFIEKTQEIGLFEIKDNRFYSEEFLRRMAHKDKKSKQARKAAMKRWHGDSNGNGKNEESDSNADAMREQENRNANKKEKEKKKDNNTTYTQERLEKIKSVHQFWLKECKDINNARLTKNQKKVINTKIEKWSVEEIQDAISNYRTIYDDESFYYSHNWTMEKFIKQGNGAPRLLPGLDQEHDGDLWKDYKKQNGDKKTKASDEDWQNKDRGADKW
uniref:Replication initiation protein n=1 Tax=uncultured organism TaxID=155900 RepID=M1P179_9ZZZZ|nr:replication initiation protein [uncultured organism]